MAWGDKGSQKESDKEEAIRKSLTEMSSFKVKEKALGKDSELIDSSH
jgi:hypothetical protein